MNPPPDFLSSLVPGAGNLLKQVLVAPDGARAEIYLHGAQVTSWIPASGSERFFLSRLSQFTTDATIRGGIPVVFPQFGLTGPLPLHGLARLMPWELSDAKNSTDTASATFRLRDTDDSRRHWPHAFLAELTVVVGGNQLAVTLAITNISAEPFAFTSGLHTYFSIADLAATTVAGLTGLRYCDAAAGWVDHQETAAHIEFTGEVNRIYFDAPAEVRLVEPHRTTLIRAAGFADTVVWNPAAAKCATFSDLEPDDYRRFVCVEAAAIANPIQLAPDERWQGSQTLLA